jgi:hypothetical protein
MTLRETRVLMAYFISLLPEKAKELGYDLAFDEGMNHEGVGHREGSLHYFGCAQDIILYKDGTYIIEGEPYAQMGTYWKTLHPDCHWGGDFKDEHGNSAPDEDHLSLAPKSLFGNRA